MRQTILNGGGGETNCYDGIDNDNDGSTDRFDPDCSTDPACNGGGCTNNCDTSLTFTNGTNNATIEMTYIPAGTDPKFSRYTITQPFYMMTTEVTQGMYVVAIDTSWQSGQTTFPGQGSDYPVYYTNWHMAAYFANVITEEHNAQTGDGLGLCYTCSAPNPNSTAVTCSHNTTYTTPYQCDGYRLPTEAEWELAARSGSDQEYWTPDGGGIVNVASSNDCVNPAQIMDLANNPNVGDYAWYCLNASNSTNLVAQKDPNGFALFDMHGNVQEWTADYGGCSLPNQNANTPDPWCSNVSPNMGYRGGSFGSSPGNMHNDFPRR